MVVGRTYFSRACICATVPNRLWFVWFGTVPPMAEKSEYFMGVLMAAVILYFPASNPVD